MDEKIVKDSQCLVNDLANDCISRKAAIDAVMRNACNTQRIYEAIKGLPSEQPETHEERTEKHACDLIDRAEAIDALRTHERKPSKKWFDNQLDIEWNNAIDICCYDIEDLPPAQPERQKGEWIDYTEDGYVECPFCHNATNCDGNKGELHFCFSCGADMRGEQE